MNKPVSLELKQLLYNKGWRYELSDDISETSSLYNNHSLAEERFNQNDISYVDITIADIIMWLYDKHGIWIGVELTDNTKEFYFQPTIWTMKDRDYNDEDMIDQAKSICEWRTWKYNSIQEAYIEAIKYCLNNKIN